jgi:hypothetical protein
MRRREHGHAGPYLPLIFEACDEGEYAYEYRDGVTSYGAFTYFLTKALFDAGLVGKKFTFQALSDDVAKRLADYYDQKPRLVGPKDWCGAQVPWHTPKMSGRRRAGKRKR